MLTHRCVTMLSECSKCVPSELGMTCCAEGGSWRGRCGTTGYEFTWADGLKACAKQVRQRRKNIRPSSISIDLDHDTVASTTKGQAVTKIKLTQVTGVILPRDDGRESAASELRFTSANSKSNVAIRSASIFCLMFIFNAIRIG